VPHALPSTTDPVSQAIVGAIIAGLFVLLALEKAHRVLVVLGAVALLWAVTYLTPYTLISLETAQAALDLNVLLLLAAMMAVVGVLKTTGVFGWAVTRLLARANGRPRTVMRLVAWFTAGVSSVADNVTTVIFVTPMSVRMAGSLGIRPVVFLLPMVMAANIGGTATLIGDPPNIMIGSGAGLSFVDFLVALTIPCAIMMLAMEWYAERVFGGELHAATNAAWTPDPDPPTITDPTLLRWSLGISTLIFLGFLTHNLTGMPAAVPAVLGAAAMLVVQDVLYLRRHRPTHGERVHGLLAVIEKEIEWPTLIFFAFLFIAVGAAVATGLIGTVAAALSWAIHAGSGALGLSPNGTLLFAALLICWVSGGLSSLIDNIPFVAVTIPIVAGLRTQLPGDTSVLWWALSLGACLGGNGTVVGASANVTAVGLAERAGHLIGFNEFSRFGVPVTVLTLVIASAYLTLHVYAGAAGALWWSAAALAMLVVARVMADRRTAAASPPVPHEPARPAV
jgi:Na+/H+ antiporter NhaD/arsenite permease-like protein